MKFRSLQKIWSNDLKQTRETDTILVDPLQSIVYQCSIVYCATNNGMQKARKTISVMATRAERFAAMNGFRAWTLLTIDDETIGYIVHLLKSHGYEDNQTIA